MPRRTISSGSDIGPITDGTSSRTRIIAQWFKSLTGAVPRNDPDARMGWIVIIGTIPIGVLGFLFPAR